MKSPTASLLPAWQRQEQHHRSLQPALPRAAVCCPPRPSAWAEFLTLPSFAAPLNHPHRPPPPRLPNHHTMASQCSSQNQTCFPPPYQSGPSLYRGLHLFIIGHNHHHCRCRCFYWSLFCPSYQLWLPMQMWHSVRLKVIFFFISKRKRVCKNNFCSEDNLFFLFFIKLFNHCVNNFVVSLLTCPGNIWSEMHILWRWRVLWWNNTTLVEQNCVIYVSTCFLDTQVSLAPTSVSPPSVRRPWYFRISIQCLRALTKRRDDIVVADMVADMAADMEVHMMADMNMDKVADMVADKKNWPTWSWTWWPTRR